MPDIFGFPSPQEVQQAQLLGLIETLGNAPLGTAPAAIAGVGLGRALGGAFGLEDAQTERARRIEEARAEVEASGVDFESDEYLTEVSRALRRRGLFPEAQAVQARGAELQKAVLEQQKLAGDVRKRELEIAAEERALADFQSLPENERIIERAAEPLTAEQKQYVGAAAAVLEQQGKEVTVGSLRALARQFHLTAMTTPQTSSTSGEDLLGGTSTTRSAQLPLGRVRAPGGTVAPAPSVPAAPSRTTIPAPTGGEGALYDRPALRAQRAPRAQPSGAANSFFVDPEMGGPRLVDARVAAGPAGKSITLNSQLSMRELAAQQGVHVDTTKNLQKDYIKGLGYQRQAATALNNISGIIEKRGPAFPTALGRIRSALLEAGRSTDMISAASRILGNLITTGDIQDPEEAATVKELASEYSKLIVIEKELRNLGVLAGPDVGIITSILTNPAGVEARFGGIGTYFRLAAPYFQDVLDGASDAVMQGALRNRSFPAPHRFYALASADIDDIIEQVHSGSMSSGDGARAARERTGLPVTGRDMQLLASVGPYAPVGGLLRQGQNAIGTPEAPSIGLPRAPDVSVPVVPGGGKSTPEGFFQRFQNLLGR